MIKKLHPIQQLLVYTIVVETSWWIIVMVGLFLPAKSNAQHLSLLHPYYTWFWLIIPMLWVLSFLQWKWKINVSNQFRGIGSTRMVWTTFHPVKAFLSYFLMRTFVFFVVLALAQPAMGTKKIHSAKRVMDLVICLDISNSMNVKDMKNGVSRLSAAKVAISEILNQLQGERIAVVVFANDAFVQLPLTMDYGAAKLFVPDIETAMLSGQGTNFGNALSIAQTQFKDQQAGKGIVMMTDGEDHEHKWQKEVEKLSNENVQLFYYGLGTSQGGLIPNDPDNPGMGYKRVNGKAIVSRLNQFNLQQMAQKSNASFQITHQAFPDVTEIVRMIQQSKHTTVKKVEFEVEKSFYQVPILLALCSLLAVLFVPLFFNRKLQ